MSKKKKKKTSLGMRIIGIFMLLLMVASSIIGIIAYMLQIIILKDLGLFFIYPKGTDVR